MLIKILINVYAILRVYGYNKSILMGVFSADITARVWLVCPNIKTAEISKIFTCRNVGRMPVTTCLLKETSRSSFFSISATSIANHILEVYYVKVTSLASFIFN